MHWTGPPITRDGVTERQFQLRSGGRAVPGVIWSPEQVHQPLPIVLLGHGGSGHKTASRQRRLARWFTTVANTAAVAIDGPYHGDRMPQPLDSVEYQRLMATAGVQKVADAMVDDWLAAMDAATSSGTTSSSPATGNLRCST